MHATRTVINRSPKNRADLRKVLFSKRNNFTHTLSQAKPDVVTTLMQVPLASLHDSTVHATKLGELDRDRMVSLLKQLRAFHRRDRTDVVVRAYQEAGRSLSPHHYTILMSHSSDEGDWVAALRLFSEASQAGKLRPQTHGALLTALTRRGLWQKAVTHFGNMIEDRIPVDSHALHVIMNATRKDAPWKTSIQLFCKAIAAGTTPNALVYLILLRCLSQCQLPSRWHYSLSILEKLQGSVERNAGMYNAVMETLGSCGRWEKAVGLFHTMPEDKIQPSHETMRIVMALNKKNAVHVVKSLAATHALAMPVTSAMYRMVFRSLIAAGKPEQVKILATAEMGRASSNPGNPNNSIEAVSNALIDCVMFLSNASIAQSLVQTFEPQIESVLPQSCAGLVLLGEPSQRWIADEGCRIAVVDHNTIRHREFETLLAHYDHVMIPATAIRVLISRGENTTFGGSFHHTHNEWVLSRLRSTLHNPASLRRWKKQRSSDGSDSIAASFHVIPLHHQLQAHSYLTREIETMSEEALLQLRKSSAELAADALLKLSANLNNNDEDDDFASQPLHSIRPATSSASAVVELNDTPSPGSSSPSAVKVDVPRFVQNPYVLQVAESILSVAVMLKTFNPKASVHFVSPSDSLLSAGKRWNDHATSYLRGEQLVELVRFPNELREKAPAVLQTSSETLGEQVTQQYQKRLQLQRVEGSPMFVPC
jgi:pentatricopeptide repeat protein